ncbi:MAG: DsbA family protein [Marinibacterium sp.]
MAPIDFWFSIGSTYSYLTVARIADRLRDSGLSVTWRPFDVRTIMLAQNNVPFRDKPEKTAYMWRDIERRASGYGLPVRVPAPYPLTDLALPNRIALLGMSEDWGEPYVRGAYRRWFVDGLAPDQQPNLTASLHEAGQSADDVIERANAPAIVQALENETETAWQLGVFGSPSFVVAGELFWGDDRLEDATAWARNGWLGRGGDPEA